MKKIDLKGLDISCYTEELNNGLQIYLIPYENKKNYYITYATRFGSDIINFSTSENNYKPPLGIAHFLEHKMFEQKDGVDPFSYFSKSGTDANASTSFDNTRYICYGTKNFNDNLRYLLSYVNSPYYTDENVNKEKGIIAEEIKMYEDIPDFKLEMEIRRAIYHHDARRIDIAGTIDEINKITKEDLYNCYNNFYTPNNMFILIVGNFDKEDAIKIIKEELETKESKELPEIIREEEPNKVKEKEIVLKENIEVPKIALGLKIPIKKLKLNGLELDLYLNMLTTLIFGSSSEFRERVRSEQILSSIYTEWENTDKFKVYYLTAATIKPDKLLSEIKDELKNISITEKAFNRIKKVWVANEVKIIDNVYATVNNISDDILKYKKIIPNKLEQIRKMKYDTLNKLIENIDFNNISIVKMISNNE